MNETGIRCWGSHGGAQSCRPSAFKRVRRSSAMVGSTGGELERGRRRLPSRASGWPRGVGRRPAASRTRRRPAGGWCVGSGGCALPWRARTHALLCPGRRPQGRGRPGQPGPGLAGPCRRAGASLAPRAKCVPRSSAPECATRSTLFVPPRASAPR
jgi:hypothetical protein